MNKLERIVKELTTEITDLERLGWPPTCYGLLYQPERPRSVDAPANDEPTESFE